jgi:hypothetical protein
MHFSVSRAASSARMRLRPLSSRASESRAIGYVSAGAVDGSVRVVLRLPDLR